MSGQILKGGALVVLIVGYGAFEASIVRNSQHLFEPLHILDEYVSANRAVERCGLADDEERRRFLKNMEAVRRRARADVAETHPKETAESIEQRVADLTVRREREVDALVDAEGCEGTEVWKLLKLHQQRARLRIR